MDTLEGQRQSKFMSVIVHHEEMNIDKYVDFCCWTGR